jgi:hypothetical protein
MSLLYYDGFEELNSSEGGKQNSGPYMDLSLTMGDQHTVNYKIDACMLLVRRFFPLIHWPSLKAHILKPVKQLGSVSRIDYLGVMLKPVFFHSSCCLKL